MRKEPKAKWPKYLIVPSEVQFKHGTFVDFDSSKIDDQDEANAMHDIESCAHQGLLNDEDRETIMYHCGTSCCFVGWACLAFGEKGCRTVLNPATVQFLNKFMELAGMDPVIRERNGYLENFDIFANRVGKRASDVFEGVNKHGRFILELELSPRQARNLWRKTGEHFNYDTANLLEG